MSDEPVQTIFPIQYLHFTCCGCHTEWSLYVNPPIRRAADLKAFTDAGKMGPCPRDCGATKCDIVFRLRPLPPTPTR